MKQSFILLTVFFTITATPWLLLAEEKSAVQKETILSQSDDIPLLDKDTEEYVDEIQQEYSEALRKAAYWIDSFFDDKRYKSEENKRRATLKLGFAYSDKDDFEIIPRVDLRLDLPRLKGKIQLIFTGGSDEDFGETDNPILGNDLNQEEYAVGIRQFIIQKDGVNFSAQAGLKKDAVFAGLRLRASKNLGSWNTRLTNRLRYFSDDKFESVTALDRKHTGMTNGCLEQHLEFF